MRARVHRFLLMLLMVALPLQALASAAMLDCVLSHPAEAMQIDDMAGCHESGAGSELPPQHDCAHCAACALASALPVPAPEAATVVPVPRAYPPARDTAFSGFLPDGPERPPRAILA